MFTAPVLFTFEEVFNLLPSIACSPFSFARVPILDGFSRFVLTLDGAGCWFYVPFISISLIFVLFCSFPGGFVGFDRKVRCFSQFLSLAGSLYFTLDRVRIDCSALDFPHRIYHPGSARWI